MNTHTNPEPGDGVPVPPLPVLPLGDDEPLPPPITAAIAGALPQGTRLGALSPGCGRWRPVIRTGPLAEDVDTGAG